MKRRRRWVASGRLPPMIAAQFTLAEQAVLALVGAGPGADGLRAARMADGLCRHVARAV